MLFSLAWVCKFHGATVLAFKFAAAGDGGAARCFFGENNISQELPFVTWLSWAFDGFHVGFLYCFGSS
jgi:hypothetical protein